MIEPINNIEPNQPMLAAAAAQSTQRSLKTQEEFLVVFYKELLKQNMKNPSLSLSEEDENPFGALTSDVMIDKLATEIARKQLLQQNLINNK